MTAEAINQRGEALEKGNNHRAEKARIRASLRSGEIALADVLRAGPPCLERTMALNVLEMGRGVGIARLVRINHRAHREGINLARPFGRLTERQREWLANQPELR